MPENLLDYEAYDWEDATLVQALNHGYSRTIVDSGECTFPYGGDYVKFEDGSAVRFKHVGGYAYSENTWEEGYTDIQIGRPRA